MYKRQVSVLDLAAGSGVWGIALAQSSNQVRVTAVDWPGVLPVTRKTVARFGLADRFTFNEGDLLDASFGSGHNVATLGHILHSLGREDSKTLLNRTFQALAPGGTIAIAEFLVNDDRTCLLYTSPRQRADHVVGLEPHGFQNRNAQRFQSPANVRNLPPQVLGHGGAIGPVSYTHLDVYKRQL